MKPEQFIKRYGVDEVKKALADAPEGTDFIGPFDHETVLVDYYKAFDDGRLALWNENEWVCLSRVRKEFPSCFIPISLLEGLVKSVELVEKFGSLIAAKEYVPDGYKSDRLKQAMLDHESIYGGGDDLKG
ncbi:hypothetical protein [Acinetobacter pittii]|uniref:hypothetical protein n=1 Tax=Acinetobacter pittii TaxID=48296 RepID=UPI0029539B28|nr:hypothetical protein [Acinetobacter pittii]MDV7706698.1 hypothetical protein [Acinetobacter pittii]MDV7759746.1 hypothetical protein [Acinetobacter pittii]